MLEKLPRALGRALKDNRPGPEKCLHLAVAKDAPELLTVESGAFLDGEALPVRFTADGAGVSPPLRWSGVTRDTATVALVVEDADSPTPQPILHLLALLTPGVDGELTEGALTAPSPSRDGLAVGDNSFRKPGWLPPDPPPAHGPHRYLFQVFALKTTPDIGDAPSKADVKKALEAGALAKGVLTGTYERR